MTVWDKERVMLLLAGLSLVVCAVYLLFAMLYPERF